MSRAPGQRKFTTSPLDCGDACIHRLGVPRPIGGLAFAEPEDCILPHERLALNVASFEWFREWCEEQGGQGGMPRPLVCRGLEARLVGDVVQLAAGRPPDLTIFEQAFGRLHPLTRAAGQREREVKASHPTGVNERLEIRCPDAQRLFGCYMPYGC